MASVSAHLCVHSSAPKTIQGCSSDSARTKTWFLNAKKNCVKMGILDPQRTQNAARGGMRTSVLNVCFPKSTGNFLGGGWDLQWPWKNPKTTRIQSTRKVAVPKHRRQKLEPKKLEESPLGLAGSEPGNFKAMQKGRQPCSPGLQGGLQCPQDPYLGPPGREIRIKVPDF